MNILTISGSPHVHHQESVKKIMWSVVIAMIPMLITSVLFFGWDALRVIAISVAACLLVEWLIQKYLMKIPPTVNDGSALITGMLLAFNVPSGLDWWIVVIGAVIAIGVAKMSFGGLGKNPFNPALVGRVFLLVSFPQQMTTWPDVAPLLNITDAITGPTPLNQLSAGIPMSISSLLAGSHGGSLGEVSAIAIVLGGLFMLWRKVITWHIPVAFIATSFVFVFAVCAISPEFFKVQLESGVMLNALSMAGVHLLLGGLLLGAIFMATDMVTSPMSCWGQILFGVGCGALTVLIRLWGAYPEGVSFAILIMNAFVPLINKGFKPKKFGIVK